MRRIARRRHHHYNRCAHIAVGPIAAAKLKVFDTCVAHSRIIRWVCVDTWTLECLHDVWLVACILLVARCLVPAFQCQVLEGCWLLVARVELAVLRQGRPPLRPELPACESHITCCPGSDTLDARLGERRRFPTSLCELERRGVRRPLTRMGRVVLIAAPFLACAVPQMCWTSLCGIGRRRLYHPNHCAHIAVGPIAASKLPHLCLT